MIISKYEENNQVNTGVKNSRLELKNEQKLSQALMINVEKDNYQIDMDGSIDNTSTSSCCNNDFCLVSYFKDNA
jgi:hypothetical protein